MCRRMQARAAADAAPRARWARVGHRPRPPLLSGAHERFGWVPAVVTQPVMMDVGGSMIIVVSYYASALVVAPNHRPCHWRSA